MNFLQRLRSSNRRGAILVWMLLLAYVCAPLAQAIPGPALTVLVPYCSPHGDPGRDHGQGRHAPQRIALHFHAGVACGLGSAAPALPASHHALRLDRLPAGVTTLSKPAPDQPTPGMRRPPPRAPPGPLQSL